MITITADEAATICEVLRAWADELSIVATIHRRLEVKMLRHLAAELEYRQATQKLREDEE